MSGGSPGAGLGGVETACGTTLAGSAGTASDAGGAVDSTAGGAGWEACLSEATIPGGRGATICFGDEAGVWPGSGAGDAAAGSLGFSPAIMLATAPGEGEAAPAPGSSTSQLGRNCSANRSASSVLGATAPGGRSFGLFAIPRRSRLAPGRRATQFVPEEISLSPLRFRPGLLALSGLAALLALGCQPRTSAGETPPGPASAGTSEDLGSRVEMVLLSDELALSAQRSSKERAPQLIERAARVRERLYRLERRQVDALEAVELLGMLEKYPDQACDASLRRALLDGEVRRDPTAAYKQLYALRLRQDDARCEVRLQRALAGLSAYRPLPNVLREIERDSQAARSALKPQPSAAPSGVAESASPAVVSPTRVPEGPAKISRVERYGADDAARIVVFVTRPAKFEVGQLKGEGGRERLFVDIHEAESQGQGSYEVGGLVERVRLGKKSGGTRVVLDLRGPAEPRVFYLPEPFRLIIDVFAGTRATGPGSGKRNVRRVVLDPGHGGHDPGATGRAGLREKDVALDIAHRAAPLIARELGITTLLTRDGDYYVPLDERTARANAFNADLFVSIHCNASEDGVAKGVMTFVLDRSREEVAERLAERENAASAAAAAELANALARVADPVRAEASLQFAELLQRAATASLSQAYPDIPDGGVKRAGFYVLAGARMPAVLFETSFISNTSGETRLNTGDFRQKMADAIVNAVRAYREGH